MPQPRVRFILGIILSLVSFISAVPGDTPAPQSPATTSISSPTDTYADLLAKAAAFAAEQSWALAAESYTAAQKLAPDDTTRRLCDLRLLEAKWKASKSDWEYTTKTRTALDNFLAPYEAKPESRDTLWVEAVRLEMELDYAKYPHPDIPTDLLGHLDITDYYLSKADTPARRNDFLGAASQVMAETFMKARHLRYNEDLPRVLNIFTHAAKLTESATDRAGFSLALAHFNRTGTSTGTRSGLPDCETQTANTPWDTTRRLIVTFEAAVDKANQQGFLTEEDITTIQQLKNSAGAEQTPTWLSATVDEFLSNWRTQDIYIEAPNSRLSTGAAQITLYTFRIPSVAWSLTKLTEDQVRILLKRDKEKLTPDFSTPSTPVQTIRIVPSACHVEAVTTQFDINLPQNGVYQLKITTEKGPQLHHITVGDVRAILVQPEPGILHLRVVRATTGAPIANTTGTWDIGSRNIPFATDQEGLCVLSQEENGEVQATGFADGTPFQVRSRMSGETSRKNTSFRADVFTDRKLHAPGEKLVGRVILRDEDWKGSLAISKLPEAFLSVSIDSRNRDLDLAKNLPIKLDSYGTGSFEIIIPDDTPVGLIKASISRDKTEERHGNDFDYFELGKVERFRPPPISLDIQPALATWNPGQPLNVAIKATYFSGEPAPNLRMELMSVSKNDHERRTPRRDKKSAQPTTLTYEQETDQSGTSYFTITPTPGPTDAWDNLFFLRAATKDLSGIVTGTAISLSQSAIQGEIEAPRVVKAGSAFSATVTTKDRMKRPLSVQTKLQVFTADWVEQWQSPEGKIVEGHPEVHPGELKERWKCLRAEFIEKLYSEQPLQTGPNGIATVQIGAIPPGAYLIRLSHSGNTRDTAELCQASLYAVDKSTRSIPAPEYPSEAFFVRRAPNNLNALIAELHPGHSIPLLLFSDRPLVHQQLLLAYGNETKVIPIPTSGNAAFIELPWDEKYASGLCVYSVASYMDGGKSIQLLPASQTSRCDFVITPNRTEFAPHGTSQATLKASRNGIPLSNGSLAIAVVDQAVDALDQNDDSDRQNRHFPVFKIYQRPPELNSNDAAEFKSISMQGECRDNDMSLSPFGKILEFQLSSIPAGLASFSMSDIDSSIRTRSHFASTAFWAPEVKLDEKGEATVSFTYPDNLTSWRWSAIALTSNSPEILTASAVTRTTLPFQARLRPPGFLVAGDSASINSTLVNGTASALTASADLSSTGPVSLAPESAKAQSKSLAANGSAELRWPLSASAPGEAKLKLSARAGNDGDAMELPLPILEDGFTAQSAATGRLREKSHSFSLDLPGQLDPARASASVQLSPGPLPAMLGALPYLVDYPYGCVEQTMSRFLPAVVTAQTLRNLSLAPDTLETLIVANESATDAARRKRTAGLTRLDAVTTDCLARLSEASTNDGYGWWPGAKYADLWMTSYVLFGLNQAKSAGISIDSEWLEALVKNTVTLLEKKEHTADSRAFALFALTQTANAPASEKLIPAFNSLYETRDALSPTGRACLAVAAKRLDRSTELAVLLRNLVNGAVRHASPDLGDTVQWGSSHSYWSPMHGAAEATAMTLLALCEIDPMHPLIEPAANFLIHNRRGEHWSNTRDTAFALLALNRWLTLRGRTDASPVSVDLYVNGAKAGSASWTQPADFLKPVSVALDPRKLRASGNTIELRRTSGSGPVDAVAIARGFARAEGATAGGYQVSIARRYDRMIEQRTLSGRVLASPETLPEAGGTVHHGEQVRCNLNFAAPHDLEYVMIEVPKPAGCDPLNPLSGWDATLTAIDNNDTPIKGTWERAVFREERTDKVAFFLDRIPAGRWQLRFTMRATTLGNFRALPAILESMYVPELRAHSTPARIKVEASISDKTAPR